MAPVDPKAWGLLAVAAATVIAIASRRVRLDVIGWGLLAVLGITRMLPTATLLAGFGSPPVLTLIGVMALGEALASSGALVGVARALSMVAERGGWRRFHLGLLLVATVWSGFLSDVGLITLLLPVLRQVHRRTHIPLRPVLLPLAVAATWGGTLTMIGSSAMIVANGLLATTAAGAVGIFYPTPVAAVLAAWGMLWTVLAARWIWGSSPASTPLETGGQTLRAYWMELAVLPDCPAIGHPLRAVPVFGEHGVTVVALYRGNTLLRPQATTTLAAGDVLVVSGSPQALDELRQRASGFAPAGAPKDPTTLPVAEVVIGPRSPWQQHTVAQLHLRRRYGLTVLGWFRDGALQWQRLAHRRLQVGDLLWVEGEETVLARLPQDHGVLLLTSPQAHDPLPAWAPWLAPLAVAVALAGTVANLWTLVPGLAGALALLGASGTIDLTRAYRAVSWRLIVFVAAMLAFAQALRQTPWLPALARTIVQVLPKPLPLVLWVGGAFVVGALVTQVLSDIPTVLLLGPLVVAIAQGAHVPSTPLLLAVAIAVGTSPLTPTGNKTTLLVLEAGGYSPQELWRLGAPLTLGMALLTAWGLGGH